MFMLNDDLQTGPGGRDQIGYERRGQNFVSIFTCRFVPLKNCRDLATTSWQGVLSSLTRGLTRSLSLQSSFNRVSDFPPRCYISAPVTFRECHFGPRRWAAGPANWAFRSVSFRPFRWAQVRWAQVCVCPPYPVLASLATRDTGFTVDGLPPLTCWPAWLPCAGSPGAATPSRRGREGVPTLAAAVSFRYRIARLKFFGKIVLSH